MLYGLWKSSPCPQWGVAGGKESLWDAVIPLGVGSEDGSTGRGLRGWNSGWAVVFVCAWVVTFPRPQYWYVKVLHHGGWTDRGWVLPAEGRSLLTKCYQYSIEFPITVLFINVVLMFDVAHVDVTWNLRSNIVNEFERKKGSIKRFKWIVYSGIKWNCSWFKQP